MIFFKITILPAKGNFHMNASQLAESVLNQYRQLLNAECTTEIVREVTCWLEQFYTTRESLVVLTMIIQSCANEALRLQAAISIKASILHNQDSLEPGELQSLFQVLVSAVLSESNRSIRESLVAAMWIIMNSDFTGPLLRKLNEEGNPGNIGAVVNVMELICKDPMANNDMVVGFMMDILKQCFESGDLELSLAGFQFLIAAGKAKLVKSLDFCWEFLLQLFDPCLEDKAHLQRLTSLFNQVLDDCPELVVNCESCDVYDKHNYDALYEKTMGIFFRGIEDVEILLPIFSVIDTLCDSEHLGDLTKERFLQVLNVAFKLVICTFDPTDISFCQFFDSVINNVTYNQKVAILWEICTEVAGTEPGKFAAISAIKVTAEANIEFYMTKVNGVIKLTGNCLCDPIEVIRTTAMEALSEFAPVFKRRNTPELVHLPGRLWR